MESKAALALLKYLPLTPQVIPQVSSLIPPLAPLAVYLRPVTAPPPGQSSQSTFFASLLEPQGLLWLPFAVQVWHALAIAKFDVIIA